MRGLNAWVSGLFVLVALAAPAAAQTAHSVNSIGTDMTQADCLRHASSTFANAPAVKEFAKTVDAVWAQNQTQWASLYCLPKHGAVVITVSGPDKQKNHELVDRLVEVWMKTPTR